MEYYIERKTTCVVASGGEGFGSSEISSFMLITVLVQKRSASTSFLTKRVCCDCTVRGINILQLLSRGKKSSPLCSNVKKNLL